jgi:hypothetical protein
MTTTDATKAPTASPWELMSAKGNTDILRALQNQIRDAFEASKAAQLFEKIRESQIKAMPWCGQHQAAYEIKDTASGDELSWLRALQVPGVLKELAAESKLYDWASGNEAALWPPKIEKVPLKEHVNLVQLFGLNATVQLGVTRAESFLVSGAHRTLSEFDTTPALAVLAPEQSYPTIAVHRPDWYSDECFGEQRLEGVNPALIEKCVKLPDNFGATTEELDQVFQSQLKLPSFTNEMRAGRIYMVNYSPLQIDFKSKLQSPQSVSDRWLPIPICLLHFADKQLKPVAIQIDQVFAPSKDKIFYPNPKVVPDQDWAWRYAKTCVQCADWLHHELASHLCFTHLVMEVLTVASHRTLPAAHPVMLLLLDHFKKTLSLNAGARSLLLPVHFNIIGPHASDVSQAQVQKLFREFDFTKRMLPNDMKLRGMAIDHTATSTVGPNYVYGRIATDSWKAIHAYVNDALLSFYGSDKDARLASDPFVQAWAMETSAKLNGFPQKFTTVSQLSDCVTMAIFTATIQHSAVNYQQYFYQGFVPNCPASMYGPRPTAQTNFTEELLCRALPPRSVANLASILVWTLSQNFSTPLEQSFGRLAHFYPRVKGSTATLLKELNTIAAYVEQYQQAKPNCFQNAYNPKKSAASIEI